MLLSVKKDNNQNKINKLIDDFNLFVEKLTARENVTLVSPVKYSDIAGKFIISLADLLGAASGARGDLPVIIATGGFGRGELAPYSDVDMLFLSDGPLSPAGKKFIEEINKLLWNVRLKPGFSVRTLEDCESAMEKDLHFLTSLLEMQHLWGERKTYKKLEDLVARHLAKNPPGGFIAAKLEERDARHRKHGDSRYHLEPNVKESKGGLRDIQTLLWLTNFVYGVKTPEGLVKKGILTKAEGDRLKQALDFFWHVRCHLHLLAGRAEDRLSFDFQPQVAERMGYTDAAPHIRAEKFMKDYFLTASETGHLTRILCADMEARAIVTGATAGTKKIALEETIEGFPLLHNRLTVADKKHFIKSPNDAVRIFRVSQTSGYDIHPDALRQMKALLPMPGEGRMPLFLDILLDKKGCEQTLRRMNEAGVLTAIIPDFANIHAHMQYDMYHVFTADEHTIRACGMMHKIENGDLAETAPLATDLFGKIQSRRALYAAMFLHDIAKGTGGQHSEKGAEISKRLCPQMGLAPEETETVVWLVENHLLMTMTAFKRDLNDDKTIADFVAAVQSPERLKLLTILTTSDIMAVGPDRWNNWKSGLLAELYHKSNDLMSGTPQERGGDHIVITQKKVRRLVGENKAALQYLTDTAPKGFWLSFTAEDIARYSSLLSFPRRRESTRTLVSMDPRLRGDDQVIKISPLPGHDHTEVFVFTPDRKGLFATLSGAMAASGASIADARIFTLSDGMALDIFQVQNLNGHVYENTAYLAKTIKSALAGTLNLDEEIAEKQKSAPRRSRLFAVQPRVIIDNNASATSTLIEVNGKDRPGFLYDITSALTQLGLQITAAKVTTFGSRAVDVFYVKDTFGLKILHAEKLVSIEKKLKNILEMGR